MHDDHALIQRLDSLERTVRRQRRGLAALALCLGAAGLAAWSAPEPEVVRARRFVAVDDAGVEVGDFGFEMAGASKRIGWTLRDPQTDAFAMCTVFAEIEEGAAADAGCAMLQLEAGHAISQQFVREHSESCSLAYFVGADEKTGARLTSHGPVSELVLASGPYRETENGDEDESRALRLAHEGDGPRVTGVDLEGATTIALP